MEVTHTCGVVWRSLNTCGGVWRSLIPVEGCGGHSYLWSGVEVTHTCGGVWRSLIPVEGCGGHSILVEGCGGHSIFVEGCGGHSYLWRGVKVELGEDPQLPAVGVDDEGVGRCVASGDGVGDAAVVVPALVGVRGDGGVNEGAERLVLRDGGGESGVGQDGGILIDGLHQHRDPGLAGTESNGDVQTWRAVLCCAVLCCAVMRCGVVWCGVV